MVTSTEDDTKILLVNSKTNQTVQYWENTDFSDAPEAWEDALTATEIAVDAKLELLGAVNMEEGLVQVQKIGELEAKLQKSEEERKALKAATMLFGRRSDAVKERDELAGEKQDLLERLQKAEAEKEHWQKKCQEIQEEKSTESRRLKTKLRERKAECECEQYRAEIHDLKAAKADTEIRRAALAIELEKTRSEKSQAAVRFDKQLQESQNSATTLKSQLDQAESKKSELLVHTLAMKKDLSTQLAASEAARAELEKSLADTLESSRQVAARENGLAQMLKDSKVTQAQLDEQCEVTVSLVEENQRLSESLREREDSEERLLRRLQAAESLTPPRRSSMSIYTSHLKSLY